jgi:hypothetical protein
MVLLVEIIGHAFHPIPVTAHDPEALKSYIQNEAPTGFYIFILLSYAVGVFTGGFVTAWICTHKKIIHAMTMAGTVMGIGIYNLTTIQYPTWVILCSIFVFLPLAYFGSAVAKNVFAKKELSH